MADIAHGGHGAAHEPAHDHPGEKIYIKVAAVLLAITIVEVVIYYIQWLHDHKVLGPTLMILSAVKFVTVVGYFMHLKFDDRRLTWIFMGGFMLAAAIFVGFCTMHYYHQVTEFASNMIA